MEKDGNEISSNQTENYEDENNIKSSVWNPSNSYTSTNIGTTQMIMDKQLYLADVSCSTEQLGLNIFNNNEISSNFIYKETDKKCDELISHSSPADNADGLAETTDLPDLSFLTNDLLLGDCNYFEQASQLVDPALNDYESTPLSFNNNNDLVQLFRLCLTGGRDEVLNSTIGNKICEDLTCKKNLLDKCERISQNSSTTLVAEEKERHNFHQMVTLLDTKTNTTSGNKGEKSYTSRKTKDRKVLCRPIKKGRRYLPNFKQEVLEYAKSHTFKETALQFQINSNTITEWSREYDKKEICASHTGAEKIAEKPDSNYKSHKTDTTHAPETKTEVILLNYDLSLETDYNEASFNDIKEDVPLPTSSSSSLSSSSPSSPRGDVKPEEIFLKWIERKRQQRKELCRQEVFHTAKYCLKKWPAHHETSGWFVLWLKRYNRVLNSINSNVEVDKYIKYPNSFKLEVVLYARLFTKNSAARVFNVSRKRTFDWFSRLMPEKQSFGETEKLNFIVRKNEAKEKLYSELHLWYQKMVVNGTRPSSSDIKEKAKEIFTCNGIKEIKFSDGWLQKFCQRTNIKLRHNEDDRLLLWILTQFDNNVSLSHQEITDKSSSLVLKKKFKGSKGWTLRFLKRHKNLLQRNPTCADQLPRIAQEKLTAFWHGFKQNLKSLRVEQGNIGCMDEIPLSFNYPEGSKSTSLPLLRKTGFENCQGIVILSILANGTLLPPVVVFKGTELKQLLPGSNPDILIVYQEKGHITEEILETWVNDIWLSCTPSPSALVVDSFELHRTKAFTNHLEKENCSLHVIPDGCSSKFQPLDVEVTPSFKQAIRDQWREFLPNDSGLCSNRPYRCPDRTTILSWIQKAIQKVNRNPLSIINSFKTTGLLQ